MASSVRREIFRVLLGGLIGMLVGPWGYAQVEVDRHLGGPWPTPGAHATIGKFLSFDLPVKGTQPTAVIIDSQHNVWISEKNANRVMRYDPYTGDFYPLVNREPDGGIQDLAMDRLGNVWFTQFGMPEKGTKGGALGVVNPGSGNLAEYRSITPESGPYGLILDSQGIVYATLYYANKIMRVDPDTSETIEYQIPTEITPATEWEGKSSLPTGIASDRNGIIWFAESRGNKIGRLDPNTGQVREFDLPTPKSKPTAVAVDSRGYPWFTLQDAHKIGRLDPRTGQIREWDVGAVRGGGFGAVARTYPYAIAIDANDVVWFNEWRTNSIASLDPKTNEISKYRVPWSSTATTNTLGIAIDALGSVWFIDALNSKLGRLD